MFSSSATSLSSCSNLSPSDSFILPRWLLLLEKKGFTVFQNNLLSDTKEVFRLLKKFFLFFVEFAGIVFFVFRNFLRSGLCVFWNIDFRGRNYSCLLFFKVLEIYDAWFARSSLLFMGACLFNIRKIISSNLVQTEFALLLKRILTQH